MNKTMTKYWKSAYASIFIMRRDNNKVFIVLEIGRVGHLGLGANWSRKVILHAFMWDLTQPITISLILSMFSFIILVYTSIK